MTRATETKTPRPKVPFAAKEWNGQNWPEGADNDCLLCKRPVVEAKSKWVHMSTAGELIHPSEGACETDANGYDDSQGWWTVGPECARKVPKGYAVTRAQMEAVPDGPTEHHHAGVLRATV